MLHLKTFNNSSQTYTFLHHCPSLSQNGCNDQKVIFYFLNYYCCTHALLFDCIPLRCCCLPSSSSPSSSCFEYTLLKDSLMRIRMLMCDKANGAISQGNVSSAANTNKSVYFTNLIIPWSYYAVQLFVLRTGQLNSNMLTLILNPKKNKNND